MSRRGGGAWIAVAALHIVPSVALASLAEPALHALDLEGTSTLLEPWRILTATWVHWGPGHLWTNVAGALALATLGWVAALPTVASAAWLLAWPLAQILALLGPMPQHLAGMSGTLHAGAAVAAVHLASSGRVGLRVPGAALAAGLVAKLTWEAVRGPQAMAGTDALTWPIVHLTGSVCGAIVAAFLMASASCRHRGSSRH